MKKLFAAIVIIFCHSVLHAQTELPAGLTAEGYSNEEALDSVDEVVELNTMIDELNRDKPTFFQQQASRK